ncbi:MAG: septation protein SpoVG family protein [Ruminococcus sp.]|nr:septation protein SpoVG family protein [Ruminococcus sp.]MBR1751887.1 septation protein SpoVG family protein [Ruminococcus sp.]MBR1752938.1 septation protein SpoVG family protein [Ruminococcus sp.]
MDVKVSAKPIANNGSGLIGVAGIVFDDKYALENIQIRESKEGNTYVTLPSYSKTVRENGMTVMENGKPKKEYIPILEPIDHNAKSDLNGAILDCFYKSRSGGGNWETQSYQLDGKFKISQINASPYVNEQNRITGLAEVTFGSYKLNNIIVKNSKDNNEYLDLPSYRIAARGPDGTKKLNAQGTQEYEYRDTFHPITADAQKELSDAVLNSLEGKRQLNARGQEEHTEESLEHNMGYKR